MHMQIRFLISIKFVMKSTAVLAPLTAALTTLTKIGIKTAITDNENAIFLLMSCSFL